MDREHWRKIERLCNSALDLEPERRESFLVETCAGDESLLRDVRLLLDMQPEAENFIESPAMERVAKRIAAESEASNQFLSLTGKTLGHYQVGEELGRGGMGEVYLADDLSLDRKVALKFLPEIFTGDCEWMARFEREAKLLASLRHPNIAVIHGIEEAEGKRFLVLELVEGETLAQSLRRGPLPAEEALGICHQIIEALEAAHEKGVIHRDLKPENVMISSGGIVKILDFGLAKTLANESQVVDSPRSPAIPELITRPGFVLGTAAYMSPEQARGKSADRRADIWAFGCILYECLTGKSAFGGETVTDTLAAILTNEPNWQALPTTIPPNIRFVLRRCLEKNLSRRFHHAADIRIQIEESIDGGETAAPARRPWLMRIWAAFATFLVIALAIYSFFPIGGRERPEAMQFQVPASGMPDDYNMAISPDGRAIAYVAATSNTAVRSLFVREMESIAPRQLNGTEGALHPFWSHDSRSIAFFAGGRLKRIEVSGGSPSHICEALDFRGGTWNREGAIIFGDWPVLRRVSSSGGEPVTISSIDESEGELAHYFPHFLPDGLHYLYEVRFTVPSKTGIYLGSVDTQEKTRLVTTESNAVYAEPGYLLFEKEGALVAQIFDPIKHVLEGEAVRIEDNIYFNASGWAGFSASQNGMLIYRTANSSRFVWLDRAGNQLATAGKPAAHMSFFDLSPDGKKIAMRWRDPATSNQGIWLMDLASGVRARLTNDTSLESYPVWSQPDGLRVAFSSFRKGNASIFEKKTDGVSPATALLDSSENNYPQAWSKDGRYLAYAKGKGSKWTIYILPLFGERKPFPLDPISGTQWRPSFSYDGRWIAYGSNEAGEPQVFLRSFPAADQKLPVSNEGGVEPQWRMDGRELYYLSPDGKLMAVDIVAGHQIKAGIPRVLFDTKLSIRGDGSNHYAVSADGRRFLLLKPLAESTPAAITVVVNWPSRMK